MLRVKYLLAKAFSPAHDDIGIRLRIKGIPKMLNLGRNDRWVDVKDSAKPEAKPTVSNAMQQPNPPASTVRPSQSPGATLRETTTREMPSAPAPAPVPAPVVAPSPEE